MAIFGLLFFLPSLIIICLSNYFTLQAEKKDNTKILTIKKKVVRLAIDRSGHSALKSEIRVQYLAGVSALTVLKFKKSIFMTVTSFSYRLVRRSYTGV